jgi:uncharacterized protein
MIIMDYFFLPLLGFLVSILTFYSGFGLGTVFLPVLLLFFPLSAALTMTAILHLLNNFFKLTFVRAHINYQVVLYFGFPALFAAFAGAYLLAYLSYFPPITQYSLWGRIYFLDLTKLLLGILLMMFTTIELKANLPNLAAKKMTLILGGILSGFFGGLSGFQGAFRSLFLMNKSSSKREFIANSAAISCLVDLARIPIYGSVFQLSQLKSQTILLTLMILAAFLGVYLSNLWLEKLTFNWIKIFVSCFIYMISIGLIFGLL